MSRVLALDWGKKRIGVAISDPGRTLASPVATFDAKPRDQLLRKLQDVVDEQEVGLIIVGLPLREDGSQGDSAKHALEFAEAVKALGLEVQTWDERYSSWEATKLLQGMNRKPSKNKGMVDRAAAALFLQSYLDWAKGQDG